MVQPIQATKTGSVFLKDFDRGVVETLGAVVTTGVLPGSQTPRYMLTVPGLQDPVRVNFMTPEQPIQFTELLLPTIVVRRGDLANALERWKSVGSIEYRAPVPPPVVINGKTGYAQYEQKVQAFPFDITYDIESFCRERNESVTLLSWILRKYQPYGAVFIKDSLNQDRSYECFMENVTVSDELVDVADRMTGFIVSLRVAGELDLNDPTLKTAVLDPRLTPHLI